MGKQLELHSALKFPGSEEPPWAVSFAFPLAFASGQEAGGWE